jgi:hypothetical protein
MNTHHVYHDKWGIFHKSASKRDFTKPSSTHNLSGCVDSLFRSTKGLAYDMHNNA